MKHGRSESPNIRHPFTPIKAIVRTDLDDVADRSVTALARHHSRTHLVPRSNPDVAVLAEHSLAQQPQAGVRRQTSTP
jgi:hypothetical protein